MEGKSEEKYYEELCAHFGKERLEQEIGERIGSFFGLLTREAAVYLLAKREGIAKEGRVGLAGIRQWMKRVNAGGKITRVFPLQKYEKNGVVKKSVRLVLEDASGSLTLVLWNNEAMRLFGEIGVGDEVRIGNAYMTREGELSLGVEGKMECAKAAALGKIGHLKDGVHNIEGVVKEIFLDYPYMKGGQEMQMRSFLLAQGEKEVRVVVWANTERVKELEEGTGVRIENALYKNNELQLGEYARIVGLAEKKDENCVEGEISGIALGGRGIIAHIGGKEIVFEGALATAILGLKFLPEGVSLATALALKEKALLGKKVKVRVENAGAKPLALAIEGK